MKKYVICVICLFMLVGCDKKQEVVTIDINFDNDYYKVYTPYKEGAGNNYIVNNVLNNYDILNVETSLMSLSTSYFKTNNSYYQEGQYLKEDELKKLLSDKVLNKSPNIKIDNVDIKPTYVSSIHEQNFLASNGHLKGISLAIVLNPYQAYKNRYGSYNYKTVEEKILVDYGKKVANDLLKYMHDKKEIKDIKILIALYLQKSPGSMLPGGFKYVGITSKDNITLEPINYQYQYLTSDYVVKHDINASNAFQNLEATIKNDFKTVYMNGYGFYQDNMLKTIEIDVCNSSYSNSELLYLSQILSEQIGTLFEKRINIRVYIKASDQNVALITKEANTLKTTINIMQR